MYLIATMTIALIQPTAEPLEASVDSDHLHRSAPPGSLQMAFCSLQCVAAHVPLALFSRKGVFIIHLDVKNLL